MSWSKLIKAPQVDKERFFLTPVSREPDGAARPASPGPDPEPTWEKQREQIVAEGFSQGRKAGQAEAEARYRAELDRLRQLTTRIEQETAKCFKAVEDKVIDLSLAIMKKIIGAVSENHLKAIRHNIRKLLAQRRETGEALTIRLHPDDHQLLAPGQEVMPRNLKMVPDPAIARGGCLLETKFGLIDAQLESQLEEIERSLRLNREQSAEDIEQVVRESAEVRDEGRVTNIVGMVIESRGPAISVGEGCDILDQERHHITHVEVIGFRQNRVLLMPLGDRQGIGPGSLVIARGKQFMVKAGPALLGRVIDGLGEPIDGRGPISTDEKVALHAAPNNPMQRRPIDQPLYTGVRAIDSILTCGKGVRMGIFAGSGVGKSVLLGMMARHTQADVNVIALIGERGREVKDFVERDLGPEGLQRSVVVAVTSDQSPVLRIHGAQLAASLAEYFARQGKDVLFMMDSVTRFAMAHREVGLAAGEPPATKGYTPSTFAALPKLLERSGIFGERGSITGFYTVLVEGDDLDEPVADHVRSILDGHVVLSRPLAAQNHFPAIDVLHSVSRLTRQVCTAQQQEMAGRLRNYLATMADAQDLVNIGAYVKGSNPKIDQALALNEDLQNFLRQRLDEHGSPEEMWNRMAAILKFKPE
jgi:flagellum-specific ATP synthase